MLARLALKFNLGAASSYSTKQEPSFISEQQQMVDNLLLYLGGIASNELGYVSAEKFCKTVFLSLLYELPGSVPGHVLTPRSPSANNAGPQKLPPAKNSTRLPRARQHKKRMWLSRVIGTMRTGPSEGSGFNRNVSAPTNNFPLQSAPDSSNPPAHGDAGDSVSNKEGMAACDRDLEDGEVLEKMEHDEMEVLAMLEESEAESEQPTKRRKVEKSFNRSSC